MDPYLNTEQPGRLRRLFVDRAMCPSVCIDDLRNSATSVWIPPNETDSSNQREAPLKPTIVASSAQRWPVDQIVERPARHEAVLITPKHLPQPLHPPGRGLVRRPNRRACHLGGIAGSLLRLADLVKLRVPNIDHAFGHLGSYGRFCRAIDAGAYAPHQSRKGTPRCRIRVRRRVGHEGCESGERAVHRGLSIASTRSPWAREYRCANSRSGLAIAPVRSASTGRIPAVP
jgi:hypothetical protein